MPKPSETKTILDFISEFLQEDISPLQEVALRAIYGLPMSRQQKHLFYTYTKLTQPPKKKIRESTFVCGRRSGKTGRLGVNVALYEALLGGHETNIGKGERAHVVLIAQSLKAVAEAMALLRSKVSMSPAIASQVEDERADMVLFKNHMAVSVWPCTFRAVRGLSIPVAVMDELGIWDVEGANPDREVLRAILPAMATFQHPLVLKLSTPWAKAGVLWEDFNLWYGKEGGPLVWKAPTRDMNPTIPHDFFVREFARDPEASRREYDAEFVDLASAFLPLEAILSSVDEEVYERSPQTSRRYFAAIDVAFKNDASVLAIGHREGGDTVLDMWRAWTPSPGKPLSLEHLTREIADKCQDYGVISLWGDQYASEPVRESFRKRGIIFTEVAFTASRVNTTTVDNRRKIGASKMDIYGSMKTLLLQGRLRLLDVKAGIDELRMLETKRTWSGVEQVGAAGSAHDDYVSALALLCWQTWRSAEMIDREPESTFLGPTLLDWQFSQRELEEAFADETPPALRVVHTDTAGNPIGVAARYLLNPERHVW